MRHIHRKILPDGSGRVRIHWLIWDEEGPIEMPQSLAMTVIGLVKLGGGIQGQRRARLACQPKLASVLPREVGGVVYLTEHTDEPRAATCPECLATREYAEAVEALEKAPEG